MNLLESIAVFNNWNIIQLSHNSTPYDVFDEFHQVLLDGISDNMASLVQSGKYDAINTTVTETNIFYVIMFKSEAYKLQYNTTINRQIITAGKLVVKTQYLCYMKETTNWFWAKHPQHQVITVPTRTTLYPRVDVTSITDIHYIPKSLCNMTQ